eukprot:6209789-Prymnesium_polylepis.1
MNGPLEDPRIGRVVVALAAGGAARSELEIIEGQPNHEQLRRTRGEAVLLEGDDDHPRRLAKACLIGARWRGNGERGHTAQGTGTCAAGRGTSDTPRPKAGAS